MNAQRTRCRGCGAAVIWIRTSSGRRMCIDADSGEPVKVPGKVIVIHTQNGSYQVNAFAYTSHFATCPKANEFRRNNAKETT